MIITKRIFSCVAVIAFLILAFSFISENPNKILNQYKVIKVNGQIKFLSTGESLETGSIFGVNEKLKFETQNSKAAVISNNGKRYVLVDNSEKEESTNLLPAMGNVASRNGALINALDFTNYFKNNFLLLDSMKIEISPSVYSTGPSTFFYLEYSHNNEVIRKKLTATENSIKFSASNIFTIDNVKNPLPAETKMTMNYGNSKENTKITLGEFTLVTPKTKELVNEIEVIINNQKDFSDEELTSNITSYLHEFYGKVQKQNLEDWLNKNINLN
jgi:hypothetical protein